MAREIIILAVGKMSKSPEKEMMDRYLKRMKTPIKIKEISSDSMREKECERILSQLTSDDWVVSLDLAGKQYDSKGFSEAVSDWQTRKQRLVFIIGGAEGLTQSVIDRSDATLSFGKVTWPHMVVRALLAEQLFRAQAIADNHPYHKADRP